MALNPFLVSKTYLAELLQYFIENVSFGSVVFINLSNHIFNGNKQFLGYNEYISLLYCYIILLYTVYCFI